MLRFTTDRIKGTGGWRLRPQPMQSNQNGIF